MNAKCFKIECITNMHVGNGDVNYNIIDNEVEKDCVTGYPTIHSSGVKGALRSFFEAENPGCVTEAFGDKADNNDDINKGNVKILNANMLFIPMRNARGETAYSLVTTETAINNYNNFVECLGAGKKIDGSDPNGEKVYPEGIECKTLQIFGNRVALMNDSDFSGVSLPVLARNQLKNGKSVNLWYEEIVPYKSVFYFFALCDKKELLDTFGTTIAGKVIQFGGNASIGYGFCRVTEIAGNAE